MVSEARKQSMAWMETDYSKHTPYSMEGKWRPAGAFGRARNYGLDSRFNDSESKRKQLTVFVY